MSDCIFCKIASQEIKTPLIAENEHAVIFADRAPRAPIHYLIVPKTHVENINHLDDSHRDITWAMLQLAQQVARKKGGDDSFRLIANNGAPAGQVVFHMHWHFMAGADLAE